MKLKDYVDCNKTSTSIEKRICANLAFQNAHHQMDSTLQAILNMYERNDLTVKAALLVKMQRAWQVERKEDCERKYGTLFKDNIISDKHLIFLTDYTAKRYKTLFEIITELNKNSR